MGNSEIRNYEVFCTTHSRIIQALSLEHAMSKFKDIDDGKIIGAWDSEYYNATESLPIIDNTVSHSPTEPDTLSHLPRLTLEQRDGIALQIDDYNLFEDLPEFDTLQEGDWFQGTEEEYRKVLILERQSLQDTYDVGEFAGQMIMDGFCVFNGLILESLEEHKKTEFPPEEFLLRAENTFKK